MSIPLDQLRTELKRLPRDVLIDLVDSVLNGGGRDGVDEIEKAWVDEAHRRWVAYLRGEVEMIPMDEAMAELRARR